MKRVLALLLAFVMALSLFACAKTEPDTKANETPKTEEPKKTEETPKTEEPKKTEETQKTEETPVQELEPVTLKWYYDGAEKEGTADVIKVFNEKLAELLPNTTVEFVFVSDYTSNWPLLVAGGEQMDLAWVGYKTPMVQDAIDGNLLPLSDLVAEYAPNLVRENEIWESSYNSAMMDGELWAIPSIQPTIPEAQYIRIWDCMMPFVDIDALVKEVRSNSKLTYKTLDIIEDAYEAAIDAGVLEVGKDDWQITINYFYQIALWGYRDFGPEGNQMVYDPESDPIELYQRWEVPEVKMVLDRLANWYDRGWITETNILGQLSGARNTICGYFSWNQNWGNADERGMFYDDIAAKAEDHQGDWYLLANRPEEGYQSVTVFGVENSYTALPYSCKNPERAMMLLNLLHDEVGTPGNDLLNLLCYGFEKSSPEAAAYGWYNYELVEEDGQLREVPAEKTYHSMTNWVIGNTYKTLHDGTAMTTRSAKEYALKFYTDIFPTLKTTPVTGMIVDYTGVADELAAVKAVAKEYKPQVQSGCGGSDKVDALYQEFLDKMYAAGLGTIKEELQSQIDAWIAKK